MFRKYINTCGDGINKTWPEHVHACKSWDGTGVD